MRKPDTRKGDRHKPGRKRIRPPGSRHAKTSDGWRRTRMPNAFLAIDGEGRGKYKNGVQKYQIMVAANDDERYVLDTGKPLTTDEILRWFMTLPKGRTLISYSFGYDVTMLAHDMSNEAKTALAQRENRPLYTRGHQTGQPRPVYHKEFALDWIPRKLFTCRVRGEGVVKISDVFSFFGTSYLKVLGERTSDTTYKPNWDVATYEEFALIEAGKIRRPDEEEATFDRQLETEYSILECKTLCRVMTKLRDLCKGLGYPLKAYTGAGAVAKAMLRKHEVENFMGDIPPEMTDAALRGFFGGRFETASLGVFENVYYYDISSAYPNIIRSLPCLAHGMWKRVRKYDPNAAVAIWHVKWETPSDSWCAFPYRHKNGTISFPQVGEGHYWASEVAAGLRMFQPIAPCEECPLGSKGIEVLSGWVYTQGCDHKPFSWITDIYELRRDYVRRKMPEQVILKLGMNSIYGVTAQTVGSREYFSAVWAGMITAGTRAMLVDAMAQAPEKVLSCATDSISSLVPLDLHVDEDKALGTWEPELVPTIFIAGDGLSWSLSNKKRTRTRGIPAGDIVWERMLEAWEKARMNGQATFVLTQFQGLTLMAARGKPELAGRWVEIKRTLRFNSHKRWFLGNGRTHTTDPRVTCGFGPSARYKKLETAEEKRTAGIDPEGSLEDVDAKDDTDIFEARAL